MPTGPRAFRPQAGVWFGDRAPGVRRKRGPDPSPAPPAADAPEDPDTPAPAAPPVPADAPAKGDAPARRPRTARSEPYARRMEQVPQLDLERIVRTTIRMLDGQGLARFSMRRLAAELGVTPMSVYWYVDNKDDLLEIALDRVGAEVPVPWDGPEADWREQLRQVARGYRAMLVAHPWASRLIGEYMNVGPRATAFSAVVRSVMRRTGLPDEMIPGALSAVYQFTYGFGTVEGRWQERCRAAGVREDDLFEEMSAVARDHPGFHGLADLVEHHGRASSLAEVRERDFAFSLDCLIAGIEAMRDRARRTGP